MKHASDSECAAANKLRVMFFIDVCVAGDAVRQWLWCDVDLYAAVVQFFSWSLQSCMAQ